MRIKIGDKFRDYVNISYVVKKYKNYMITFEVDNGEMKDEVYKKSVFVSELQGNRFYIVENQEKEK